MSTQLTPGSAAKIDRLVDRFLVSPEEAREALEEAEWNFREASLIVIMRDLKVSREVAKDMLLMGG